MSLTAELALGGVVVTLSAQGPARTPDPVASRVDPHVPKVRVVVLADIANEPDDQMSLVRFLVDANHFDVEGIVATTSTWLRTGVRPDVLHTVLDAYAEVQPGLASPTSSSKSPTAAPRPS